jgi:ABC-2 type transport system permease protein
VNFGRLLAMAGKEGLYILRDPRSLGVAILLPVLLLVLYGYAINFDVKGIPLAVYDPDRTPQSRDLIASLSRTGYFKVVDTLSRPSDADRLLQSGRVAVVLLLPPTFAADLAAGRRIAVQSLANGSDSLKASVGMAYLEAFMGDWLRRQAAYESPRRVARAAIEPEMRVWYNPDLSTPDFVVPGLVVVILMMLAALLTSQTVVREREQGTIEGLVVSPVTKTELLAGKLLPYAAIAAVDVCLVAGAGYLLFRVPMRGDPLLLLTLTTVYLIAALAIGLVVSVNAKSQRSAYLVALIVTLLPTILLTGFVFPISSMPRALQAVVQLHPATHFLVIVRAIVLKGAGLGALWGRALALVLLTVVALGISLATFKKTL